MLMSSMFKTVEEGTREIKRNNMLDELARKSEQKGHESICLRNIYR
jgi:hypothetical protein